MKKVALTVAVLALGLAACESKTADAVENADVTNSVEADTANALEATDNAVDNALDATANAGEAVDNAAANTVNATDNAM